jgi:hypothetical protein
VNYAEYVAPLLSLLRTGVEWKWTKDMQSSFEHVVTVLMYVQADGRSSNSHTFFVNDIVTY